MKRIATVGRRLALAAVLAGGAFLLSTGYGLAVAAEGAAGVESAVQDDEKKKRKAEKKAAARAAKEQKRLERQRRQRGRTVRAVVVPSEPAAASEPAAIPAPEPAAVSAPEPASAPKAAPEPVTEPARAPVAEPVRTAPAPTPVPEQPRAARLTPAAAPARDISLNERIRVAEVLLDVLVTDRKGNVIDDLGAEDFVVLHDGEEQEVTSASFYGGPSELASPGGGDTARTDRYFILMFHDQRMQAPQLAGPQMDNARWLKRWIEEELQPNDQVAVFAYQARLKVYLDFTRNRDEILAAVDAASRGKKDLERWVTRSEPEFDPNSPSLVVNLPVGKELARRSRKLQQGLELLGEAASGIAGRKNLVMFSLGFGEIGQFGSYTPDPRYYPQMREALNAGNVAVYTIDTMGSRRRSIASASLNDSLSLISNETGGHYYANFTNIMSPMRQVAEENQGYYLVSFRSEYEAGTQGYRDIKVKVRDGSYKVRSRTGFRYGESSGP
ncbi:MAG: VWA domain-containing protein [Acidobacteriota bacterium]|nr:VWA domain-containing protein [Acidobacteriota bacterium]MDE3265529.1 VWA domain-containing protein [Acidobacteriota bacterium]